MTSRRTIATSLARKGRFFCGREKEKPAILHKGRGSFFGQEKRIGRYYLKGKGKKTGQLKMGEGRGILQENLLSS